MQSAGPAAVDGLRQVLVEHAPIEQPGQHVARGLVAERADFAFQRLRAAGDALADLVRGATFDDFLLRPQYSVIARRDPAAIDLSCRFSTHITLKRPLVSANMDTVTRAPMATPTGRYLGMVHFQKLLREPPSRLLGGVIDSDINPLDPETSLPEITRRLATYDLVAAPVVDDDTAETSVVASETPSPLREPVVAVRAEIHTEPMTAAEPEPTLAMEQTAAGAWLASTVLIDDLADVPAAAR